MIGHIVASAALAGIVLTGVSYTYAQMSPPAPAAQQQAQQQPSGQQQAARPADQTNTMHKAGTTKSTAAAKPSRMMAKSDNIADRLNACQLHAEPQRKTCMDQALQQAGM